MQSKIHSKSKRGCLMNNQPCCKPSQSKTHFLWIGEFHACIFRMKSEQVAPFTWLRVETETDFYPSKACDCPDWPVYRMYLLMPCPRCVLATRISNSVVREKERKKGYCYIGLYQGIWIVNLVLGWKRLTFCHAYWRERANCIINHIISVDGSKRVAYSSIKLMDEGVTVNESTEFLRMPCHRVKKRKEQRIRDRTEPLFDRSNEERREKERMNKKYDRLMSKMCDESYNTRVLVA